MANKVYTITYGDVAENHAKMQKIGTLHENGYSIRQLEMVQAKLNGLGLVTEIVDLDIDEGEKVLEFEAAKVLIIRRGAQFILGEETDGLIEENDALTMDKKAFMKGKVVNKVARWNLCFADEDQEPDYEDGKGRIVAWEHIPKMARIRQVISEWTEDVLLNGEANYYYDLSKCGIGYHGDAERKKVFAVRMGESMPLFFQWFQRSMPIGNPIKLELNDGDMYMMSEKAVGFDWLKKVIPTLRHSTGCAKFTGKKIEEKKQSALKLKQKRRQSEQKWKQRKKRSEQRLKRKRKRSEQKWKQRKKLSEQKWKQRKKLSEQRLKRKRRQSVLKLKLRRKQSELKPRRKLRNNRRQGELKQREQKWKPRRKLKK